MKLQRTNKISRADAKELILSMVRFGNHSHLSFGPNTSEAEVRSAFERMGHDFDRLIESARSPEFIIPYFETLLGSTMHAIGGRISVVRPDGSAEVILFGDGQTTPEPYWGAYEGSSQLLAAAVEKLSMENLLAASQRAIASVEGFIAERSSQLEPNQQTRSVN
jgi:hypothetical protein